MSMFTATTTDAAHTRKPPPLPTRHPCLLRTARWQRCAGERARTTALCALRQEARRADSVLIEAAVTKETTQHLQRGTRLEGGRHVTCVADDDVAEALVTR
jgi:hypothetical protein